MSSPTPRRIAHPAAFSLALPVTLPPRHPLCNPRFSLPTHRARTAAAPTARLLGARGRRRRATFSPSPAAVAPPGRPSKAPAPAPATPATPTAAPRVLRKSGMNYPVVLSPELRDFLGAPLMTRAAVLSGLCRYVREKGLYAPGSKRHFVCDETLEKLFKMKGEFPLLRLQSLIGPHLTAAAEHGGDMHRRAEAMFGEYLQQKGAIAVGQAERKRDPRGRNSAKAQRELRAKGEGMFKETELSESLSVICQGKRSMSRPTVLKSVWDYIKEHNLQDAKHRRVIVLDEVLKEALQVSHLESVDCFQLPKYVWRQTGKRVQKQRAS